MSYSLTKILLLERELDNWIKKQGGRETFWEKVSLPPFTHPLFKNSLKASKAPQGAFFIDTISAI